MQVGIETTQNVNINFDIATVGDRILATLVDGLVILGYVIFCFILFASIEIEPPTWFFVLLYLPIIFYHLLFETFLDGQSPGKRTLKTKVVKLDGSQPSIGSYLLRWLLAFIDMGLFSGAVAVVIILINGKGQRLGDIAAGTMVIKLKPRITLEDTILTTIENDYVPVFPQVSNLNDRDATLIKEVIDAGIRDGNGVAVALMYDKVRTVLGIEQHMQPLAFLQTVLKDYNYYTGERG